MTDYERITKVTAYEMLSFECGRYMSDLEALVDALRDHGVPPQAWLSFDAGPSDTKVTAKWDKAVVMPPISRDQLAMFPDSTPSTKNPAPNPYPGFEHNFERAS